MKPAKYSALTAIVIAACYSASAFADLSPSKTLRSAGDTEYSAPSGYATQSPPEHVHQDMPQHGIFVHPDSQHGNQPQYMHQLHNPYQQPPRPLVTPDPLIAVAESLNFDENNKPYVSQDISIGRGAQTNAENTVSIGQDSYTDRKNTVSVGNSAIKRQIINVADGKEESDAVTVRQLGQSSEKTLETGKQHTNEKFSILDERITDLDYGFTGLENGINDLNDNVSGINNKFTALDKKTTAYFQQNTQRIDTLEKRVNAGIAGVTAISSIPYVTSNDFSFGVGIGNYKNGNALAAGAQYKPFDSTNIRLNASVDNEHNTVLGAGLAIGW